MDNNENKQRVLNEEDYIRSPKFSNSLAKYTARNSEGVDNSTIARLLLISEEEVEQLYQEAIQMLRDEMVDED